MTQQIYTYRLPSGKASLIEPLTNSGFFELSASSFSKNHLLQALAEALTLLHNQNKPALESQQQNTSMVPANEQTQPPVGAVACAAQAHPDIQPAHGISPFEAPSTDPIGSHLEAITCHVCDRDSFEPFLSENGVYLICNYCKAGEWLGFGSQLSKQSVDKVGQ